MKKIGWKVIFKPVRPAVPDDADGLFDLMRMAHRENGHASLDDAKMQDKLMQGIRRDRALIGVIGEPGIPIAAIGLYFGSWWYSTDVHIEDLMNYVHPDHRAASHGRTMLKFAKHFSDQTSLPLLMGVTSNSRTEAKVHMYQRQLPFVGGLFLYLPPGVSPDHHLAQVA